MKNAVRCLFVAVVLMPSLVWAVDTGIDATTIFRFEERSVPGFGKQTIVPATQFLGVDMDKLGDGNLSFHIYGWGRVDLADRSTDEGDTDGDLAYGYFLYRLPRANGQVKAGRFFIYEGVAADQIDGVSARADISKNLGLAVFGGVPVKLDRSQKSKGDYIIGGRMNLRLGGMFEIGASALQEGNVPSSEVGPAYDRQMAGGDIWFSPHRMVELTGHTYYNISTRGVAEHSYLLNIKPLKTVTVTGAYDKERFKDYFTFSNLRSVFNPDVGDKLEKYGGSVAWTIAKPLEITADYRHYKRDTLGNSDRFGGEFRLNLLDNKVRAGLSYHRSDGASGINSYDEVRGFGMYRGDKFFGDLDAIIQIYDHPIHTKHNAFEVIATAGYRIIPELALSGDISYGENPQYTSETRGVVRLTYNFNSASKGANK